jgi:hypothetical protein
MDSETNSKANTSIYRLFVIVAPAQTDGSVHSAIDIVVRSLFSFFAFGFWSFSTVY